MREKNLQNLELRPGKFLHFRLKEDDKMMREELSVNQEEHKESMVLQEARKESFKRMEWWLAPISS